MSVEDEPLRFRATDVDGDLLYTAWVIICNASQGDWSRETAEWQDAAARFRERFHTWLDESVVHS